MGGRTHFAEVGGLMDNTSATGVGDIVILQHTERTRLSPVEEIVKQWLVLQASQLLSLVPTANTGTLQQYCNTVIYSRTDRERERERERETIPAPDLVILRLLVQRRQTFLHHDVLRISLLVYQYKADNVTDSESISQTSHLRRHGYVHNAVHISLAFLTINCCCNKKVFGRKLVSHYHVPYQIS